jgi:hypothetical protein
MEVPIVVEPEVAVVMRDGARLVADVYRPADADRHPVLVHRTPYGRRQEQSSYIALSPVQLARAGFAVVVQDTRGRWDSGGGPFQPFLEGADGYDTVQWAAGQPWSDGRVGAFGSSYMGATTLQAAAEAPPALVAMCPAQASSDYFEGRTYYGGAFEYGALVTTSLIAMLPGSLARAELQPGEARAARSAVQRILDGLADVPVPFPLRDYLGGRTGPLGRFTPWFFDWVEHSKPDEYWQALTLSGRHPSMQTSGLHITSWYDQFHVGTLDNFAQLRKHPDDRISSSQFLIVGPWHHFGMPGYSLGTARVGDSYFGTASVLNLAALQQAWFETQLTGRERFRQRARVRYFLMGRDSWREADDWPPPEAAVTALHLDDSAGSLRLSDEPAETSGGHSFDYDPRDPVPTCGGSHLVLLPLIAAGPVYQDAIADRRDVLIYQTAPLATACAIAGPVSATLHVRSDAPATDFTCRLADNDPAGGLLGICDGIVRTELGSDGTATVTVSLGSTAYEFRAGHSIALMISSSNFPRFDPNPNTGESAFDCNAPRVARQVVMHGPEHPSHIEFSKLPS